jgi:hypothetical protein
VCGELWLVDGVGQGQRGAQDILSTCECVMVQRVLSGGPEKVPLKMGLDTCFSFSFL